MIIDPELRIGVPELRDIRIVPDGKNPGRRIVTGTQCRRPVKSSAFIVPGVSSKPGQAVNKDNTTEEKTISV